MLCATLGRLALQCNNLYNNILSTPFTTIDLGYINTFEFLIIMRRKAQDHAHDLSISLVRRQLDARAPRAISQTGNDEAGSVREKDGRRRWSLKQAWACSYVSLSAFRR